MVPKLKVLLAGAVEGVELPREPNNPDLGAAPPAAAPKRVLAGAALAAGAAGLAESAEAVLPAPPNSPRLGVVLPSGFAAPAPPKRFEVGAEVVAGFAPNGFEAACDAPPAAA